MIADNAINTIRLGTNKGLTGYKISKLELMPNNPGNANVENVVQVFTNPKSGDTSATINFNDPQLIAAGYFQDNASSAVPSSKIIVLDDKVFNQDIFVTQRDIANPTPGNGTSVNYVLHLEQVKLDVNEATVATLKDMRGRE